MSKKNSTSQISIPSRPANLENVSADDPFKKYCFLYIKEHFNKLSQREIARNLNIGKTTVNHWSQSVGLYFKKYTSSENFFKTWSTEMSYILGYISADGSVAWDEGKGYYSLTITAAEKDKEHLEKIRALFKSTKPLLYARSTKSYRLIVNSKKICRDLINFGIIPRKSLTLKFPEIPNEYLADYVRGYIDGDGSLKFFRRPKSPYFELSVCSGSIKFIKVLREKVSLTIGVDSRISKTKNTCYLLRYSCRRGLNLADWIYKKTDLFLERKYKIYQEALSFRKEQAP